MTVTASSRAVSLAEDPCGPYVRIVPRSDAGHLNLLTPHRFRLLFPATWKSPYPAGNVYADAFERPTLEWLSRFGLVTDEEDMQTLRRFSCGRYGGYSSPRANFRDGLLITQFVSLWLFW